MSTSGDTRRATIAAIAMDAAPTAGGHWAIMLVGWSHSGNEEDRALQDDGHEEKVNVYA